MIHIYSNNTTLRLTYTLDFIFEEVLLTSYTLNNNIDEFKKIDGCKLNYSIDSIEDSIQIIPFGLLFEKGIKEINPKIFLWQNHLAFFKTSETEIPFDFFSAIFYLITRYEEYLDNEKDFHGRYAASSSFAFKNGFLQKPLIDFWCYELKKILVNKFGEVFKKKRDFKYIASFDIDNAYAYLNKNFVRTFGNIIKDIATFNFSQLSNRLNTIFGYSKDPYDTYDYIQEKKREFQFDSFFFFLIGNYHQNDKNLSFKNKRFRELINHISKSSEVGIHPSYYSNQETSFIEIEKKRLEEITDKKIVSSRQHYLKLSFPNTYRNLSKYHIQNDYTMGYSDQPGFRASTCTPFYFFDLKEDKKVNLKIHPFAYMEVTFHTYLKMSPFEAAKIIDSIIKDVKKVEGTFISLWHNESLSENRLWKGWRFVFESTLKAVFEK